MRFFNKILIANRGEIAVRIIKSAKELGICTATIFSKTDRNSLHVQKAKEAYFIEGEGLQETYLNMEKIISIAIENECQAIHPGYGFLSENYEFAELCEKNKLIFIGPTPETIGLMGDKTKSTQFIRKLGIPVIQNFEENNILLAKYIPFPLLIKPSSGGGGKAMKIVQHKTELFSEIDAVKREALSYFKDDRIRIEKYIENARHIEVQILGDYFGNIIVLSDRDCSIQRRYQKIIEESPSLISNSLRKRLHAVALEIGKAISYLNAGTIEFLVDQNENYYFLEMNTRIQVEHPVTEMITGMDIVKEQIKISSGYPIDTKEIFTSGHAIEARVYAENTEKNFMPSTGKIKLLKYPSSKNIRIDSGIDENSSVSHEFDPMLSKIIAWGDTREDARNTLLHALNDCIIHGVKTNILLLKQILNHSSYINNNISVTFCEEELDDLREKIEEERKDIPIHIPMIGFLHVWLNNLCIQQDLKKNVWNEIGYWRILNKINLYLNSEQHEIAFKRKGKSTEFLISGGKYISSLKKIDDNSISYLINKMYHSIVYSRERGNIIIEYKGHIFHIQIRFYENNKLSIQEKHNGKENNTVYAPLFGKISKINVQKGDEVKEGDLLLVIESMKMENNILSPKNAIIKNINVKTGTQIEENKALIHFMSN